MTEPRKPELADEHERIVQELETAARIAKANSDELFDPEFLKDVGTNPEISPKQE